MRSLLDDGVHSSGPLPTYGGFGGRSSLFDSERCRYTHSHLRLRRWGLLRTLLTTDVRTGGRTDVGGLFGTRFR